MIDRLSADLRGAFPDMRGFSPRNLRYMRAFATAYPEPDFRQHAAANLPWGHVLRLLDTVSDPPARAWYAQKAVEHGWSRAILTHQIEATLYERQGQSQTNFERTLAAPQSDLARQVLKDPYNFEAHRDTPLYRLKTPAARVGAVLTALAEGVELAAVARNFGHRHATVTCWLTHAGAPSARLAAPPLTACAPPATHPAR